MKWAIYVYRYGNKILFKEYDSATRVRAKIPQNLFSVREIIVCV